MKKNQILAHRGLAENSYEGLCGSLKKGFGIEFDLYFVENKRIVIHHYFKKQKISPGRLCFFEELAKPIKLSRSKVNAVHFKGVFQNKKNTDTLIEHIKSHFLKSVDKFFVFDIKPNAARYLHSKIPGIHLAPSVSHANDIKNFNKLVDGTLITIEEAIQYRKEGIYDWVWLDQWNKKLYTKKNFQILRKHGYRIALISPELHGKGSPSSKKLKQIVALQADAICTDYPEEIFQILRSA